MLSLKLLIPSLILIFSVAIVYYNPGYLRDLEKFSKSKLQHIFSSTKTNEENANRLFTVEELSKYDGSPDSPGLYLALLGKVFNVEKGAQHYKPGGGYAFFTGKDATRAYVTGEFNEEGLTDSIDGLDGDSLLSIEDWVKFYETDYEYVGNLVGTFYDNKGNPTQTLIAFKQQIDKARHKKELDKLEKTIFPACNSEWNADTGGRVWCSPKSGGIDRAWSGVPRQLYDSDAKNLKCVCVRNKGSPSSELIEDKDQGDLDHPNLKEYTSCDPSSISCKIDKL